MLTHQCKSLYNHQVLSTVAQQLLKMVLRVHFVQLRHCNTSKDFSRPFCFHSFSDLQLKYLSSVVTDSFGKVLSAFDNSEVQCKRRTSCREFDSFLLRRSEYNEFQISSSISSHCNDGDFNVRAMNEPDTKRKYTRPTNVNNDSMAFVNYVK